LRQHGIFLLRAVLCRLRASTDATPAGLENLGKTGVS